MFVLGLGGSGRIGSGRVVCVCIFLGRGVLGSSSGGGVSVPEDVPRRLQPTCGADHDSPPRDLWKVDDSSLS